MTTTIIPRNRGVDNGCIALGVAAYRGFSQVRILNTAWGEPDVFEFSFIVDVFPAGYAVQISRHRFDGQVFAVSGVVLVNSCDILQKLALAL